MAVVNLGSATAKTPASPHDGSLAFRTKFGFGIGDFAFNLYWHTTTLYLLYYYTDVVGLSPMAAGWIFGGAMLWDALCDPVAGYIANRTRSRWGRYRPYLLFGCVPLGISFTAMFIPSGAQGAGLLAWVLGTHVLFRTSYTALSMPYNALMATLTSDSQERVSLAAYRMLCAKAAGLLVAFATLKLVQLLSPTNEQHGFLMVMMLYALASIPVFLLTFFSTEECPQPATKTLSAHDAWSVVRHNRALLLVCGMACALAASSTFLSKTLPYVMKYVLHREDLIGLALGIVTLQAFVCIPLWAWLMRRTSKRLVALSGGCIGLCAYGAMGWQSVPSVHVLLPLLAVVGISTSATMLSVWAMIPDSVEYGEWCTGIRGEGTIFGVFAFAQKSALAIAVGSVGHLLNSIGFVANQPQTPQALAGIWTLLWQGPLAALTIAMLFTLFYPISPATHTHILGELRLRRAMSTAP